MCYYIEIVISQPGDVKTIEGTLFKALVQAGAVSQDNADDPVKVSFYHPVSPRSRKRWLVQVSLARAARTDAGVHAAGNVVSLKMIVTVPGVKDLVAHINQFLPPEIRLWGFVRLHRLLRPSRLTTFSCRSAFRTRSMPGCPYLPLSQISQTDIVDCYILPGSATVENTPTTSPVTCWSHPNLIRVSGKPFNGPWGQQKKVYPIRLRSTFSGKGSTHRWPQKRRI